MKNTYTFLAATFFLLLASAGAVAQQTVDERLQALEARVSALAKDNENMSSEIDRLKQKDTDQDKAHTDLRSSTTSELTKLNDGQTKLRSDLSGDIQQTRTDIANLIADSSVGTVIGYMGPKSSLPKGWRLCDNSPITRAEAPKLFVALGVPAGTDTIKLPDFQGVFLRGMQDAALIGKPNRDPDTRTLGQIQSDLLQLHKHVDKGHDHPVDTGGSVTIPSTFGEMTDCGDSCNVNGNEGNQGNTTYGVTVSVTVKKNSAVIGDPVTSDTSANGGPVRTGTETRPVNAAVWWIIKVQ